MPGGRTLALAAAVGIGVGLYLALWFHWPTFIAIAIGATMAVVLLLFSASLDDDPAAADAAWRAAAPDLADRERAGRTPGEVADPAGSPAALPGPDGRADR